MGHAIGGGFLDAKTKEEAMKKGLAAAKEFASYNVDRQENPYGDYGNSFEFYNRIFDSEEEAYDFFYNLGSYRDGVCMVKEPSKGSMTRYRKKYYSISNKKAEFLQNVKEKFKERTSKTVKCKECGCRSQKDMIIKHNLHCPSCGKWMVSDTTKARYEKFVKQLEEAGEQLKKETAEKGKIRYWAKYEVHC